jgi:hypothetical protein
MVAGTSRRCRAEDHAEGSKLALSPLCRRATEKLSVAEIQMKLLSVRDVESSFEAESKLQEAW